MPTLVYFCVPCFSELTYCQGAQPTGLHGVSSDVMEHIASIQTVRKQSNRLDLNTCCSQHKSLGMYYTQVLAQRKMSIFICIDVSRRGSDHISKVT